jgi:hypothetical protein
MSEFSERSERPEVREVTGAEALAGAPVDAACVAGER